MVERCSSETISSYDQWDLPLTPPSGRWQTHQRQRISAECSKIIVMLHLGSDHLPSLPQQYTRSCSQDRSKNREKHRTPAAGGRKGRARNIRYLDRRVIVLERCFGIHYRLAIHISKLHCCIENGKAEPADAYAGLLNCTYELFPMTSEN